MSLTAGSRLGPYEIEAALGEGGMGAVYRARDTRLGRTVAIKILHASLAADPLFARRFENEARTLSRIAHPNICVLHDVGVGTPTYLVLEYLDGAVLTDRIAQGPLPVEEVRRLGIEICRALQTAHNAGIVHRDLKPANVMLTRSGAKLLDFGIALEQRAAAGTDPTTAIALTVPGTIVGTAAYMAPEQLAGLGADWRSDIFALGVVLYEAATGRRAFPGDTPTAIAAAILSTTPPPPSTLRGELPAGFDTIIAGCLARDREERWQSAHDVGRQLEALSPDAGARAHQRHPPRWAAVLPWAIATLALASAIGAGAWAWQRPAASAPAAPVAFKVLAPAGTTLADTVEGHAMALSPDGALLGWVGVNSDTTRQIWVRPLGQLDARALPGTEGALTFFWSPDSRSIAFFAKGLLQRLDLNGAGPVVICPVQRAVGYTGTWGADGRILFSPVQASAILGVSTSGGTPEPAIVANTAAGEHRVGWPTFLPDGRTVLYLVLRDTPDAMARVMLRRPDGSSQRVVDLPTEARYVAPGSLVFAKGGALLAQRFDLASGRLSGDPAPIAPNVQTFPPSGWSGFSVASNGTIAFLTSASDSRLTWIDGSGEATAELGAPGNYLGVTIGPDRQSVLATRMDNATSIYDIWSLDLARGTESRVTAGPSTNIAPLILPGQRSMIFSKTTGGPPHLFERDLGAGTDTRLTSASGFQEATALTKDGGTLVYVERQERGDWDIWTLPLTGTRTPAPLIGTTFDETDATLSPDNRILAFVSDETGHREIYVAPFPQGTPRYRVSSSGGTLPRWSAGGKTLLFVSDDRRVMRADITFDATLRAAAPLPLFAQPLKALWRDFLVAPDGRILAIVPDATPQSPLTVITNALNR